MDSGFKRISKATSQRGFTLVELVTTMAVMTVVLTIAGFSLSAFLKSTAVTTATNDFLGSLMLAKSEAVKRGASVVVCRTNDGATCHTASSGDGIWDNGWLVFFDDNQNNIYDRAPAAVPPVLDELVRVYPALNGNLRLRANTNLYDYIAYQRNGMGGGSGLGNGSFAFCNQEGAGWATASGWEVQINNLGRAQASKGITTKCDLNIP